MTPRARTSRLALIVLELVLAALLVVAAFWCWHRGLQTSVFPPYTQGAAVQPTTYYSGPWVAAAVGAVVLAGLGVIDAARRCR